MAMLEHLPQPQLDRPSEEEISGRSTAHSILHAIGQASYAHDILEFMAMHPLREWAFDLFVYE